MVKDIFRIDLTGQTAKRICGDAQFFCAQFDVKAPVGQVTPKMLDRLLQVKRLSAGNRDEMLSVPKAGASASDDGSGEGVEPALVENAAKLLGFPLGPLQLTDETSIDLGVKIAKATKARSSVGSTSVALTACTNASSRLSGRPAAWSSTRSSITWVASVWPASQRARRAGSGQAHRSGVFQR